MKKKIAIAVALILSFAFMWWLAAPKNLKDYADFSVVIGVLVALVVYITNSYFQYKQRISENAIRYLELHSKIFKNEFLAKNIQAMEKNELKRKPEDEQAFNRLLGEIEHLALLSSSGVVSRTANIYMFGWFARHIKSVITAEERKNVYWELAVKFIDDLAQDAEDFYKKTKDERNRYFSKNHFFH